MKRDLALIRELLIELEGNPQMQTRKLTLDGFTREEIDYHARLLLDAQFAAGLSTDAGVEFYSLRWKGHEFIDAARDDTVWRKATEKVGATVGSVSVGVMRAILGEVAMQQLGLK